MSISKYLNINHSSGAAVYRQVMDQIKKAVASGDITENEKLPTIRELAALLRINHNTIAKVYNELEREKIIYKRQGMGSFVSAQKKSSETIAARKGLAAEAANHFLLDTWSLQLSQHELADVLQIAADKLNLDHAWISDSQSNGKTGRKINVKNKNEKQEEE